MSKLFFADDTIIFGRENNRKLLCAKRILETNECASGQAINFIKSEIMFSSGVPEERGKSSRGYLGVIRVNLGIPINVDHSKSAIFRTLVARVEKKLKVWKSKMLSQGKLVLIKSVVQSIPT